MGKIKILYVQKIKKKRNGNFKLEHYTAVFFQSQEREHVCRNAGDKTFLE